MQNQQPHNSLTLQLKRPLADNGSRKRLLVFSVSRKRLHVANESKKRLHVGNESKKRLQDANRKRPHAVSKSRKRLLPASVLMSNSRLISNSNNPTTNSRAIISSNPISNRLISSRLTSSLTTRLAHKAQVCPPFRHSHQHQEAVPTSP